MSFPENECAIIISRFVSFRFIWLDGSEASRLVHARDNNKNILISTDTCWLLLLSSARALYDHSMFVFSLIFFFSSFLDGNKNKICATTNDICHHCDAKFYFRTRCKYSSVVFRHNFTAFARNFCVYFVVVVFVGISTLRQIHFLLLNNALVWFCLFCTRFYHIRSARIEEMQFVFDATTQTKKKTTSGTRHDERTNETKSRERSDIMRSNRITRESEMHALPKQEINRECEHRRAHICRDTNEASKNLPANNVNEQTQSEKILRAKEKK